VGPEHWTVEVSTPHDAENDQHMVTSGTSGSQFSIDGKTLYPPPAVRRQVGRHLLRWLAWTEPL